MPRLSLSLRSAFTFLALTALIGFTPTAARNASAQEDVASRIQKIRDAKQQMILDEFRHRKLEAKERAEMAKKARKPGRGGKAKRDDVFGEQAAGFAKATSATSPFSVNRTLVAPTNTKANNKAGDAANAGQAEQSLAFLGQKGLCAWNDGQGFVVGPDVQGYAYTVDGGATWVDGGAPPHTAAILAWTSDPVVTVNEKTGDFYYCGLFNGPTSTNGVGIVRGYFVGNVFNWDTPRVVASGPNASAGYDKQWMCADSLNGNLYVSYTLFVVGGDNIFVHRSTNNGVTWDPAIQMNTAGDFGYVQGSRPAVGPNGEVYVIYSALGPVDADFMKIRKSTDAGLTYNAEVVAASVIANFGTGAPGFNRSRGITFPSIAVDRSLGPNRGHVYVTYNEAVNWYNEYYAAVLGTTGAQNEIENNASFANATPFTIGQTLRGAQGTTTDIDHYKFSAVQGTNYIFVTDSLRTTLRYTIRIYCPNDTTFVSRLVLSGDASNAGRASYFVWTAPSTATYYLRWQGAASTGGYRIQTGTHTMTAGDNARDQRDANVVHSSTGAVWSGPTRMNDDSPWYDNWLPEVAVPCDGNVYGMWFDFRDAAPTCGGGSHIYLTRSTNDAVSWAANQVATTAQTPNWTQVATNIAPNQGDYNGMYGGDAVGLAWADGRLGDVDVFAARLDIHPVITCPNDTTVLAASTYSTTLYITNPNQMFSNEEFVNVTLDRNWPGVPSFGSAGVLGPLGSTGYGFNLAIPDSAANGDVHLCFTVTCAGGTCVQICCVTLHVVNLATATLASLIDASADNGTVRVSWQLASSANAHLYRSVDGTGWSYLTTLTPDGSQRVSYEDGSVVRGQRYWYRLGIVQPTGEVPAGEVAVDVPMNVAFALNGARPNPSSGRVTLSFSLIDNSPARIELVDLGGRRVFEREVGSMGAGFHVLPIGQDRMLPIGIYAVRLTQHGRVLSSKVTIIR